MIYIKGFSFLNYILTLPSYEYYCVYTYSYAKVIPSYIYCISIHIHITRALSRENKTSPMYFTILSCFIFLFIIIITYYFCETFILIKRNAYNTY